MQPIVKNLRSTLSKTFSAWSGHEAPRLAAALSFYTILSLAPLVILVIAIVSLAFGHSAAQGQLISQIRALVGEEGAKAVQAVIEHSKDPASGGLASVIGVITLLVGASGVCGELQSALNKIWEVQAKTGSGIVGLIRTRFFSFAMVLGIGFLLLVSLVISSGLAALGKFFGGFLPMPEWVMETINFLVSFAGISVLFALIYKFVPDARIDWRYVWEGAIATALLFTVASY